MYIYIERWMESSISNTMRFSHFIFPSLFLSSVRINEQSNVLVFPTTPKSLLNWWSIYTMHTLIQSLVFLNFCLPYRRQQTFVVNVILYFVKRHLSQKFSQWFNFQWKQIVQKFSIQNEKQTKKENNAKRINGQLYFLLHNNDSGDIRYWLRGVKLLNSVSFLFSITLAAVSLCELVRSFFTINLWIFNNVRGMPRDVSVVYLNHANERERVRANRIYGVIDCRTSYAPNVLSTHICKTTNIPIEPFY